MPTADKVSFSTSRSTADLRASSGLVSAVRATVGAIEGVDDILVLHRNERGAISKFFVIISEPSVGVIERVVGAMVQLEEAFRDEHESFDYDTVPKARLPIVPKAARSVLHADVS